MRLYDIYKNDIDRDINGVIKVAQDDEKSIKQELVEYVITRELRKHFATFLNNYEHSIDTPTDKMGVWISGFFGSGKSHFLKILSYLLSNETVAGKSAVDYFADKFDDPKMYAQLQRCSSIPTDTILFNIDSKSPINKDATAILRVFAKVFYEHLGFYGNDLKVAKMEQFISKTGKMDEFKEEFENINGETWENARDSFAFWEDDVVEALTNAVGISEIAARNWFNGEETAELTIEQLVVEIREYVNSRGNDYRLLFMIDEVGQYIGSDGSLMLNLQTIVEEIGSKCGGRVWVMVTSQEAIDSITKISGDDFSKIQGRFNTRLSLSSSSVDEVIKKRILAKTDIAEKMLKMRYDSQNAILKNLYTFNDAQLDLKGYENETDFIESYPFVPYQFRLVQNVLAEIRKHGNSGKHLSGGERSMLSGFQEAAQVIKDKDDNALIPFSLFYNTVHTFLDGTIRRVIDRCQTAAENHDGIEEYDVSILKLLYLIRYVNDIKSNVDNITTLMIEDVDADKITMRKAVQESLDRLLSQNYIGRNGDIYTFLTDDEQEIALDIKKTPINSADITQRIAEVVFGDLFVSKKFKYEKYDFPFDQIVDDTAVGSLTGSMKLRILTVASDLYNSGNQTLILKSTDKEAILLLSDEYPYFEEIENAMKIRKYVKGRNVSQLPEAIQSIIRSRQQDATAYEKRAKELITNAILHAEVFVQGEHYQINKSTVKDKIEGSLAYLVDSVYSKLYLVNKNYDSDQDLQNILNSGKQVTIEGMVRPNSDAADEVMQFLDLQEMKHLPTSMGDIHRRFSAIPYGWREIDIAAIVAGLVVDQQATIQYSGSMIQPDYYKVPDYLRRRNEIDKTIIRRRVKLDPTLVDKSRKFLRDYFNVSDVPSDEDGLVKYVVESFAAQKEQLIEMFKLYNKYNYPDKSVVEGGIETLESVLSQRKDNVALLKKMLSIKDDLLDLDEDIVDVKAFFKSQRPIFDECYELLITINKEKEYFETDEMVMQDIDSAMSILQMAKPYKKISELPNLILKIKNAYNQRLTEKRQEVVDDIKNVMAELSQTARADQKAIVAAADAKFDLKSNQLPEINTLTDLDAMRIQIQNIHQAYLKMLIEAPLPKPTGVVTPKPIQKKVRTTNRASICNPTNLTSEEDIDVYVEKLRYKLKDLLSGNDELHII